MGRFSHLDFDGPMEEPPKPKPNARPKPGPRLRPPPLTGPEWGSYQPPAPRTSRFELRMGRNVFAYMEPQDITWVDSFSPKIPMIEGPKLVEIEVSTREEGYMDRMVVRLGVRLPGGSAWDYQQVSISFEALRDLRYETPVIRKPFAPGHTAVVAVGAKSAWGGTGLRAYVDRVA